MIVPDLTAHVESMRASVVDLSRAARLHRTVLFPKDISPTAPASPRLASPPLPSPPHDKLLVPLRKKKTQKNPTNPGLAVRVGGLVSVGEGRTARCEV